MKRLHLYLHKVVHIISYCTVIDRKMKYKQLKVNMDEFLSVRSMHLVLTIAQYNS